MEEEAVVFYGFGRLESTGRRGADDERMTQVTWEGLQRKAVLSRGIANNMFSKPIKVELPGYKQKTL